MKVKHGEGKWKMPREVKMKNKPKSSTREPQRSRNEPSKPRRLRHDERRAALLQAAKEVTVEQGVATASLDAIIKRSGGSRRSIYTEFGGKAGLLAALIDEISTEILASLGDGVDKSQDIRTTLTHFAHNLITVLMSARGIALSRIVIQDGMTSPERASIFIAKGPGNGARRLAEILEAARARGEIEVQDGLAAAHCFIGMIRGNLFLELLLQLRPPPDKEEAEARVNTVVDIFLNGLRSVKRGE
jgi:AcrR family transcriptional regulator